MARCHAARIAVALSGSSWFEVAPAIFVTTIFLPARLILARGRLDPQKGGVGSERFHSCVAAAAAAAATAAADAVANIISPLSDARGKNLPGRVGKSMWWLNRRRRRLAAAFRRCRGAGTSLHDHQRRTAGGPQLRSSRNSTLGFEGGIVSICKVTSHGYMSCRESVETFPCN
ncbi:hypothetical protein M433DRAFT_370452 [Acidomyces richmondensis BFW]|nr:hypothetical protein M433DRAFT_370452 [Acidomyces richmondensis BFW]